MATKSLRGTVVQGIGSFYTVRTAEGEEYILRAQKKVRRTRLSPLPGDEVLFSPPVEGSEHGWLEEILPRKTLCLRPPVANVETLIIVLAPEPEPDLMLADRQIARAVAQGMRVLIAVNKSDLDDRLAAGLREEYAGAGIPVFPVCALTGAGLPALREAMGGSLCCFSGQSGAGKSTTINALMHTDRETGDLSRKIARGKNTTRTAVLLEKEGLRVMDTAGFSLLEAERNLPPETLRERYTEFLPYEGKCRFNECLHDSEPGCAVAEAAKRGEISPARWQRYRMLLAETRENWKNRFG
ncbi:MAG: ribosome small subunit-dependent GTPase A [Clostridia bacterium]|nr:ribosome small subunit-dependent GTPase A [Clostridia bacterium]